MSKSGLYLFGIKGSIIFSVSISMWDRWIACDARYLSGNAILRRDKGQIIK